MGFVTVEPGGRERMDANRDVRPSVVMFVVPAFSWTFDTAPTFETTIAVEVTAIQGG